MIFGCVFLVLPKHFVLAQFPSFELYPQNGTPYPTVDNVHVYKYNNLIIITARAFDLSGISSLVANIEDPNNPGQYLNVGGAMYDDGYHDDGRAGDGIYGTIIDASDPSIWDPNTTYSVDISATDNLLNNSMSEGGKYTDVAEFTTENSSVCANGNGATICISTAINSFGQMNSFVASPSSTVQAGSTTTLLANILAAGQTIIFRDQTALINIGSAVTGQNGTATIQYKTTWGAAGEHVLSAITSAEDTVPPAYSTTTINITSAGNCEDNNGVSVCISASVSPCLNGGTYDSDSGTCSCTGNWDSAHNCGTCSGHWDPLSGCASCLSGWTNNSNNCGSPDNSVCNNHGTYDPINEVCSCTGNWDPYQNCNFCLYGYAGNNCNSPDNSICSDNGTYDPDTGWCACNGNWDQNSYCSNCKFGWENNSNNCGTLNPDACNYPNGTFNQDSGACDCDPNSHWDPNTHCSTCLYGYAGENCNSPDNNLCANHGTYNPGNGSCACNLNSNWDPGTHCASCLGNYDPSNDCVSCWGNWDISTGCTSCLGNWNPDDNCYDCKTGWTDNGDNCGTAQ